MLSALIIFTAGILPAFEPWPGPAERPLLWETPVSWAPARPAASPMVKFEPAIAARITEARKIDRASGPAAAIKSLEKVSSPELLLLRAGLKRKAGQMSSAQADYELILKSDNRTAARALALSGLKNVLRQRIGDGEKQLYGRLVQGLKDEWLNEEALSLMPAILADPDVSAETKAFVRSQEPIMALRLGQYDRAAAIWSQPATRSETQWLAQTELRRGNFVQAAEIRRKLAIGSKGKARLHELSTAFSILAKGGLPDEAAALAAKYSELKKQADYNWRLGLAALSAKKFKGAEESFKAVIASASQKNRHPGARYFLARTVEADGRNTEAASLYKAAAESGLSNYYRIMALGRLNSAEESTMGLGAPLGRLLEAGPSGEDYDSLGFYLWVTEKGFSRDQMDRAAATLAETGRVLPPGKNSLNPEVVSLLKQLNYDKLFEFIRRNETAVRSAVPESRTLWLPLAATVAARGGDYRLAVSLMSRIPSDPPKV